MSLTPEQQHEALDMIARAEKVFHRRVARILAAAFMEPLVNPELVARNMLKEALWVKRNGEQRIAALRSHIERGGDL